MNQFIKLIKGDNKGKTVEVNPSTANEMIRSGHAVKAEAVKAAGIDVSLTGKPEPKKEAGK